MKNIKKYSPYLILLVLLCIVVIFERHFLYKNLIEPITHIIWYFYRLITSIDQRVVWYILVFIAFITTLILLNRHQDSEHQTAYSYTQSIEDRQSHWKKLICDADTDITFRKTLEKHLREVARAIPEHPDEYNGTDIDLSTRKKTVWQTVVQKMRGLYRFDRSKFIDFEFQRDLDQFLESMESKMEITNDKNPSSSKDS